MKSYNCPHCHLSQQVKEQDRNKNIPCIHCGSYFIPEKSEETSLPFRKELLEGPLESHIIDMGSPRKHPIQMRPRSPYGKNRVQSEFFIEGYTIKGRLGRGGMGQVFHARQESLGREVAIKVLDASLARNEASVLRFEKEAKAMVSLDHPNIVRVLDRGQKEDNHYLILEYVDGPSLRDLLNEDKFRPHEALRIIHTLARTMEYAHKQGVIHRDLKPENILYTSEGILKVADFGLAAIKGASEKNLPTRIRGMTHSHVSMGTECYMAPEQRKNAKHVDARADIYSMGVILFELITGKLPLPHLLTPDQVLIPEDPAIDALIRRCLAEDPNERFATTGDFCKAIEQLMDGEFVPSTVETSIRDTIIDTPAIEYTSDLQSFGHRIETWSKPVMSSVEQIASHISDSWSQPATRKMLGLTAIIAAIAITIVLIFIFILPTPKTSIASSQAEISHSWIKQSAQIKSLPQQHTNRLIFDLEHRPLQAIWGYHPRQQWKTFGNWEASPQRIEQNTYQNSFLRNHRVCYASYRGHALVPSESGTVLFSAQMRFLPPKVPFKGSLIPLDHYLRKILPKTRIAIRYPSIGLGFKGFKKSEIALLAYPRSGKLIFSLKIRRAPRKHLKNRLQIHSISLRYPFRYSRSLKLALLIRGRQLIAKIDGRKVLNITLTDDEIFPLYPTFYCRDAHCHFSNIKAEAPIIRRNSL